MKKSEASAKAMIPLTQPSGREPDDHALVYPRLPCCRHWPFAMSEMGSACVKTKTDLVVLAKPSDPELDQFGTTVKPGRLEVLEIDDTFCAAHGGQQLAFWNAHHDERGFCAGPHLSRSDRNAGRHHPAAGADPERHRSAHHRQDATKRVRKHWSNTRIVQRGDSHYGRTEVMGWAEDSDNDYIFSLPGNSVLDDALVADAADNLRFHHARSNHIKLRTYTSFAAFQDKVRTKAAMAALVPRTRPSATTASSGHFSPNYCDFHHILLFSN
jgi:Transposase DDE domain group 1